MPETPGREIKRSRVDPARQAKVRAAYQQVEAQWEHEEKATKKMKAKKYTISGKMITEEMRVADLIFSKLIKQP